MMERYTLQAGPGEPDMVPSEGGAWVRWDDVAGTIHEIDSLAERWHSLYLRQHRLNVVGFWNAIFFSALFAVMFLIEGKATHAVVCGIWTALALVLSLRAWPLLPAKR
jgi:hypothetical protein